MNEIKNFAQSAWDSVQTNWNTYATKENIQTQFNTVKTAVEDYVGSHNYGSIYCAVVASEATARAVGNLVMFKFKEFGSHAVNAAIFAVGAVNPVAGVVVPIGTVFIDNLNTDANDRLSHRYSYCTPLKMVESLVDGIAKEISRMLPVSKKVVTVGLGAIAVTSACYAMGVTLPSLAGLKLLPISISIGIGA